MFETPYSAGQTSANDNAANMTYQIWIKQLKKVMQQYQLPLTNALYDSYIRAFRWASDRINDKGVIGFVTNAGWVNGNAADGFRKCLENEFSKIYVFHLRGNARTSGELRRKKKEMFW